VAGVLGVGVGVWESSKACGMSVFVGPLRHTGHGKTFPDTPFLLRTKQPF